MVGRWLGRGVGWFVFYIRAATGLSPVPSAVVDIGCAPKLAGPVFDGERVALGGGGCDG